MCTLTWCHDQEGFRVYFNRDEKRARLPAVPPAERIFSGVRVLTAIDGDAGGSWLTVNEHGIAVAVLNFYDADVPVPAGDGAAASRGHLVLRVAPVRDVEEADAIFQSFDSSAYRPFLLAVIGTGEQGFLIRWNGTQLSRTSIREIGLPLTTSSFQTAEVLASRRAKFHALAEQMGGVSDAMLEAFHRSRDSRGGAHSVTMTRPDARTVSFSVLSVDREAVSFQYAERPPTGDEGDYCPAVLAKVART